MAFAENAVISGLNSYTVGIGSTAPHSFSGKLSLPSIVGGTGPSSVVVSATQNGTTVYTGQAGANGFKFDLNCTAGDTIVLSLTSAASVDNVANAVKATVAITKGV
jgi:hypothetical protein